MPANFTSPEINLREVANEVCGLNDKVAQNAQALLPLQAYAGRNLLINGDFSVWQRGDSFAGNEYTADRWLTTGSVTSADKIGNVEVASRYQIRLGATVSSGAVQIVQRIESGVAFGATDMTLTFKIKQPFGDWTGTYGVDIDEAISENDFSSIVSKYTFTGSIVGTDWNTISVTFDSSTIDKAKGFQVRLGGNADTGTLDIADVQLELGSHATEFEYVDPATQLARCQRYYEVLQTDIRVQAISGSPQQSMWVYKANKRVAPTVVLNGATVGVAGVDMCYFYGGTSAAITVQAGSTVDAEL